MLDQKTYPNLAAILQGTVSGHHTEWPAVRVELQKLVTETSRVMLAARDACDDLSESDATRLIEALRQWKCPSCGGATRYVNHSFARGKEVVPCRKCAGTGLHPTASAALGAAGADPC